MRDASVPAYALPETNRQILLVERPTGIPQPGHFRVEATRVPVPGDGQILVRNLYLSVDPAQRGWACDGTNYATPVPINSVMRALGVGIVLESRLSGFSSGDVIYGWIGWQDYVCLEPSHILSSTKAPSVPISAYAGVLGINGLTAWLAFHDLGRPHEGESVLVSTAAGAVGSAVGQLARAAGCRTIGLTGGDEKARLCCGRFGYDAAIDYHAESWAEEIAGAAPNGLDIFFDSVGGEMLDRVLRMMRTTGRVIQCGTASIASWVPPPAGLRNEREVLTRRLTWSGFVIFDHRARFAEAIERLTALIHDGRLVYDEDIETGIDHAPDALRRLYAGENKGKKLIFIG
jgi:NADPH-dependent curcumin reductase CurA